FELTKDINWTGDNVLGVEVDSTERKDIPPFGNLVDYLTFGGIYREVSIRAVSNVFIENVFAKPVNVLTENRGLDIKVYLNTANTSDIAFSINLMDARDDEKLVQSSYQAF